MQEDRSYMPEELGYMPEEWGYMLKERSYIEFFCGIILVAITFVRQPVYNTTRVAHALCSDNKFTYKM